MPLHTWILLYLASLTVAAVSLTLTYYGPLATGFWTQRYRRVDPGTGRYAGEPVDHVGPILELGMAFLLATGTLFLAVAVFPETTDALIRAPGFGLGTGLVVAVVTVGVAWTCFISSPGEHDSMIRREDGALDKLPPDVAHRVVVEVLDQPGHDVARECRQNRLLYLPYFFYSLNVFVLVAALLAVIGVGLAAGGVQWHRAESDLAAALRELPTEDVDEEFFYRSEVLLGRYATFQDTVLDFARNLLAVVAVFLLVVFWLVGTSYPLIYNQTPVRLGRFLARGALVVLALLVIYGYADLALAADRVNSLFGKAVRAVDLEALSTDSLARLNALRFTVSNEATVDDFWARLVNSYGGLMLVVGAVVAFLRQRSTGTSFLGSLLPRPHRHPFLAAVLSVRDEDGWSAAPTASAGDGGDSDARDNG